MKIYIAGSWKHRLALKEIGLLITENCGHEIVSTWFHEPDHAAPFRCATADLLDIDRADCILLFMEQESSAGGRMVELGYAIGKGKRVALIGKRTNVFTYLVPQFDTWEEALQ